MSICLECDNVECTSHPMMNGKVIDFSLRKFIVKLLNRIYDRTIGALITRHLLMKPIILGDRNRLSISEKAVINNAFLNTNSGRITIRDYAFFGHGVSLITGEHDYNKFGMERINSVFQGFDIVIEEGAWIGANSTIIAPCYIGKNSVIAAGSVVVADVPEYTIYGGVPAKFIKGIDR